MNQKTELKIDPYKYVQPIFDKDTKTIQWRKDNPFDECYWSNWASTGKKGEPLTKLRTFTKINSKLIKALSVIYKTTQLLEKKRKSSGPKTRQRDLRFEIKSMIHKKEGSISRKLDNFQN